MSNVTKLFSTLAVLSLLVACPSPSDTDGTGDPCDCPGAEGLPNVLGFWTGSFASVDYMFDETCGIENLDEDSEEWIQGAFEIDGYGPISYEMILGRDEDNPLSGVLDANGAMAFSGRRTSSKGEMYVSISGLVYNDIYQGRMVWEGMVYIGLDTIDDGEDAIDCYVRGDWTGLKSGG